MVIIKRATRSYEQSNMFTDLILMSAPYFYNLFGDKVKNTLKRLFSLPSNLFSFEHVYIAEYNGNIAGMVLGYDYKSKKKENFRTGILLFKFTGPVLLKKTRVLLDFNNVVGKLNKGDFYISNIAVYPKFRGRGIGRRLMLEVEKAAIKTGMISMVLDVEKDNTNAISLYKKLGYEIEKESYVDLQKKKRLYFLRMRKKL